MLAINERTNKACSRTLPAPVSSSRHDMWQRYPATLFHIIGYSAFCTRLCLCNQHDIISPVSSALNILLACMPNLTPTDPKTGFADASKSTMTCSVTSQGEYNLIKELSSNKLRSEAGSVTGSGGLTPDRTLESELISTTVLFIRLSDVLSDRIERGSTE